MNLYSRDNFDSKKVYKIQFKCLIHFDTPDGFHRLTKIYLANKILEIIIHYHFL